MDMCKERKNEMKIQSKNDFKELMFSILNPLIKKYSKGCAFLDIGSAYAWYEVSSSRMEAFARPLWGLIPFWAGGGTHKEFEEIYIKGVAQGTNKNGMEYWGDCRDYDQKFVEMAALAYGLMFAPEKLWEPLSDDEKQNFAQWLYQINDHNIPQSNWLFFRVLVNIALKKNGMKYSQEHLENDLDTIETFYLGDGWYGDGIKNAGNGQKDYYIAFAIHFYSLIYAKIMENEDPDRSEKFKQRAYKFAQDYIYWFSDSGAAVPYGRSQTYRFAQISFWGACIISGVKPFSLDVMKGIIVRNLLYWFENNDIFDNAHILNVGYKYNQYTMAENYNSPGSPYWGMKAFVFMMLPDNDEFWSVEPSDMPNLKPVLRQEHADLIISRKDGNVVLYPAGTLEEFGCGGTSYKYLKFAYSSKFGFSMPRDSIYFAESAPDSSLAFEIDKRILTRIKNNDFKLYEDKLVISWSALSEIIEIKTEIIPTDFGHIRRHRVESKIDCIAYDSGFAVSNMDKAHCRQIVNDNFAAAENDFSNCKVQSESGTPMVIEAVPNTNLIFSKTVIPTVMYKINKGINEFETYFYYE